MKLKNTNLQPVPTDGWDDTATEAEKRIIRGPILKFNDWKWSIGKEKEWIEVKAGRCLVALATAAGWVKWQGGKPAEYRMREPGVPMPERAIWATTTRPSGSSVPMASRAIRGS